MQTGHGTGARNQDVLKQDTGFAWLCTSHKFLIRHVGVTEIGLKSAQSTGLFILGTGVIMGGVYQGLGGGLSPPMKPRTFRHSSMEGVAITCSVVDEHLTIKVICCWFVNE